MENQLTERVDFRMFSDELQKIDNIVKALHDKYDNRSHFIRCAVLNQIKADQKEVQR